MAIQLQSREQRFLTYTNWKGYLSCREALEGTGVRITYDRGRMELMTPSPEHAQGTSDLGRILDAILLVLELEFSPGGNPTMRREAAEKGLEPDECYYLGENATRRLTTPPPGLTVYPPDLALEVEVTRSALNRIEMFQSLGVAEVWRYDYELHEVLVHTRQPDGTYAETQASRLLPQVPVERLGYFVQRGLTVTTSRLIREVTEWARSGFPPL